MIYFRYISANTSSTCLLLSQQISSIWNISLSPSCWVLLLFSFKLLLLLLYLCTCHNPKGLTATLSSSTLHPCKAELKLYSIILLIAFRWQAALAVPLLSPPRAPQQAAADWLWIRRVSRSRSSCKPCGKMRDPARLAGTGNTPPTHLPQGRTAAPTWQSHGANCLSLQLCETPKILYDKEWRKIKELWK